MSTIITTANRQRTARVTSVPRGNPTGGLVAHEIVQNPPAENYDGPRQPTNNPAWWPTDHRRVSDYRPARYHPEWNELTDDSTIMPIIILVLFGGCHLISVGSPKKSV